MCFENILIFGDSYSTFEGYIPEGYATYYSEREKPQTDVRKVTETWWYQLISETNSKLVLNNSWSASTIGYTGYYNADCSNSSSFIFRLHKLVEERFFENNKIDTVFVFGGTNDSWCDAPLGSMMYEGWQKKDLYSVLPAICYFFKELRDVLPETNIICLVNTEIKNEIAEALKSASETYNIQAIEFHAIDKCSRHPTVKGMQQIKEQILERVNHCTLPEQKGLSSEHILKYLKYLEDKRLSTHDMILMRGNDIIFEAYWKPFHKDYLHRMYSVTKSFVSIAIGFLEQDGLVHLDDKISKYFANELVAQSDENMKNQTIRHMLMMSTAKTPGYWFGARPKDRVQFYFENNSSESRTSGTIFEYDSDGSFVLGALVERLTGKTLMSYLREKLFNKIGVSQEAYCLKCPGGHSWGDSALICKPSDLLKVARFVMNGGKWNGEQLLNEEYLTAATSKQIDNNPLGLNEYNTQGYGYYFWRTYQNSFSFNGMGCQFAICVPDKDLIMIYNGDNQGDEDAGKKIFDSFFRIIVDNIQEETVAVDKSQSKMLEEYVNNLKLSVAIGNTTSSCTYTINDVWYQMKENPMGITKMKISFNEGNGLLEYVNEQGLKKIRFGMGYNVFGRFPQEGYSNEIGTVQTENFYLQCAASGAWIDEHKLFIKVQIIDKYFGRLNMVLDFHEKDLNIYMNKCAEDFLKEYTGYACGHAK